MIWIVVISLFLISELIGGLLCGSLIILFNVIQKISLFVLFVLKQLSFNISVQNKSDSIYSYGYLRVQELSGLALISVIWFLSICLIIDSIYSLYSTLTVVIILARC